MSNAFSDRIGITTEEAVTNAVNLGSDYGDRVIGLAVARLRGVANKPKQVSSLKEDVALYGGHDPSMYSSYTVESLFNNSGGFPVSLFETRIVGQGSVAAKAKFTDISKAPEQATVTTKQNSSSTKAQSDEIALPTSVKNTDTVKTTLDVLGNTYFISYRVTASNLVDALKGYAAALTSVLNQAGVTHTCQATATNVLLTLGVNIPFGTVVDIQRDGSNELLSITAGNEGLEDVGSWGNELRGRLYPMGHISGSEDGYKLEVYYKNYLVENFVSNGRDYRDLISQVNSRSAYVMLTAIDLNVELVDVVDVPLSGGIYVAPTEEDFLPTYHEVTGEPLGLAVFEGTEVNILACPEIFSVNSAVKCHKFAEDTLKFYVFNLPYLATESVAQSFDSVLKTPNQSFCASILNWVEVASDSKGNKIWIPALGYALGAGYVKVAGLNNGYIWTPPAGTGSVSKGVYRITHESLTDTILSRFVKKHHTNVIKYVKNVGFCLYSSRTYSSNTLFESIHVRLETNWLIASLPDRNSDFLQKLISPSLTKDIITKNTIFFTNIYNKGGIEQSIPKEEAIIIEVTISKEDRKQAELDIFWIPPECLEHMHIRLNRNDGVLILMDN